jgi:hypothetical protein
MKISASCDSLLSLAKERIMLLDGGLQLESNAIAVVQS